MHFGAILQMPGCEAHKRLLLVSQENGNTLKRKGGFSKNHRRVELEGAHKAIESNPLHIAGIYPKAYLTDGCPAAS